jgi:hypothetical protein
MKTELINLTDKELEIFVRKRLGQQDAELCESEKDHLRFNFHAATAKEKENNFHILALFEDIYEAGDHYHSPTVVAYKGALWIGAIFQSVDEMQDYSGWGTVQIMVNVIKRYLIGYEIYNGHANEVPRISPD